MRTITVQAWEDLPRLSDGGTIYIDVETDSSLAKEDKPLPYGRDRIVGYSITDETADQAWYLPVRHSGRDGSLFETAKNLDPAKAVKWIGARINYADEWVNHNVKFDAHFIGEELRRFGILSPIVQRAKLIDTLSLAKLVDMHAKLGGYGLKTLAKEWCGRSVETDETINTYLDGLRRSGQVGRPTYADIPIGILSDYAGDDVLHNRALYAEIKRRRYEGDERVWEIERALTGVLYRMERRGVLFDASRSDEQRRESECALAEIEEETERRFGRVDLGSRDAVDHWIFERLGLPIVSLTDTGSRAVDAMAIQSYIDMSEPGSDACRFAKLLHGYREHTQYLGLYAEGWAGLVGDDGRIHTDYNQSVRTGRMSSRSPNMQQLNKRAKRLIVPDDGMSIISRDYSQIEYRIIAHYMGDPEVLRQYRENPATDYHQLVADMVGIGRRPAKNVNFGIAFGMGVGGLIRQLAKNSAGGEEEAERILDRYHRRFPLLRSILRQAERTAMRRGYVRTVYGRRRALPRDFARKGFNSAVQGSAADIAKEALIRVDASERLADLGAFPVLIVHDEIVTLAPVGAEIETGSALDAEMVSPSVKLPVPLYTSGGHSAACWADAA